MQVETIRKSVESLVEPVAAARGLELVDLELAPAGGRTVLRLVLDRDGGITIDELAQTSREVGDVLDAHDVVPMGYTLECSSPGVNRPLREPGEFAKFCGEDVSVRTSEAIEGARNFAGRLLSTDREGIVIEDRSRGRVSIAFDVIQKANYEHDFSRDLRGEQD